MKQSRFKKVAGIGLVSIPALASSALAVNPAVAGLTTEATDLTTDLTTLIPIAIGVGLVIFGASLLVRTFKRMAR